MKITFKDLMRVSESLEARDEQFFIDYLNRFEGDNVFYKFKNILKAWERDVSYEISLGSSEKTFSLQLSYLLSVLVDIDMDPMLLNVANDDITIEMGIPKQFHKAEDVVPIHAIVKDIRFGRGEWIQKYGDISEEDKKKVIDNLPAEYFNKILKKILNCKNKTSKFENPNLKDMNLNFLSGDPYRFLINLFSPYGRDYYRDVIYYLSSKIAGDILLSSTMMDIEYYIHKMEDENKQESNPQLS